MTNITRYTAHKPAGIREGASMEEKIYKTMNGAGAMNIVLGVIALAVGVATGVLLIISGAKLLSGKSKILF